MIATDITGNAPGGMDQMLTLLQAVSADPKGYAEKLKALQDATEEHKKFVALVSPTGDVLRAREEVFSDRLIAKQELGVAKVEATKIKADAKTAAKATTDKADKILADAQEQAAKLLTEAQQELSAAKSATAALKAQTAAASAAEKTALARADELTKMQAAAKAELEAAQAERAALVAKIEAFAKGL